MSIAEPPAKPSDEDTEENGHVVDDEFPAWARKVRRWGRIFEHATEPWRGLGPKKSTMGAVTAIGSTIASWATNWPAPLWETLDSITPW